MSTAKLQKIWQDHGEKILAVMAVFLTAVVSFQAGKSFQKDSSPAEIKVSLNQSSVAANPADEKVRTLGEAVLRKGVESQIPAGQVHGAAAIQEGHSAEKVNCPLVGSKNSDKYHLANCGYASKIKAENKVCFPSEEEAHAKGYQPAKCCHK